MHRERGDIILRGLLQIVAGLLILGLVIFEVVSVAVTSVQLDEAARTATRAAAQSYNERRVAPVARQAAVDSLADQTGIAVERLEVSNGSVVVTVSKSAPVLVVDRIGPLAGYARATITKTTPLRI